eukprot:CAMPEP_0113505472 /NCGR_PEP_ID=MMETSP0014_2-20120614/35339_1 /TAXON_ID=2857 /ORGANISM="Nitzschia sp." /LENGTH=252 /DNA_ID=CAMNT_0000400795 /DNA_START=47 /DNA_END=802 /DNA_ORIENTATION=+ /assembly_acc=CAM_ASM_000159
MSETGSFESVLARTAMIQATMMKSSVVLLLVLVLEAMMTTKVVGATGIIDGGDIDIDIDIDRANDCCHVLMVTANPLSGVIGGWTFAAQMSSLYEIETGWDKYCDAFQIAKTNNNNNSNLTGDVEVLTTRVLAHPHQTEQPFTRSTSTVIIDPLEVEGDNNFVLVASARDSVVGYCGDTVTIDLRSSLEAAGGGGQNQQLTAIVATREPTQAPQPTQPTTAPHDSDISGNETDTTSQPSSSCLLLSSSSSWW